MTGYYRQRLRDRRGWKLFIVALFLAGWVAAGVVMFIFGSSPPNDTVEFFILAGVSLIAWTVVWLVLSFIWFIVTFIVDDIVGWWRGDT